MAESARTPLVLGDVFRDTCRVLARHGLVLFLLSLALVYSGTLVAAWMGQNPILHSAGWLSGLGNGVINWLITTAPNSFFLAATIWTTAQALDGRSPAFSETIREGLRFTLPVLVVQGLFFLGMMAGTVLLVVPGIILALMWALVTQVLVVERLGMQQAFGRSRALTKGHRWTLLGLVLVTGLAVVALEWALFQITTPGKSFILAAVEPINAFGVIPLINTLLSPVTSIFMTAIYLRLRDGYRASAEQAAEVFS